MYRAAAMRAILTRLVHAAWRIAVATLCKPAVAVPENTVTMAETLSLAERVHSGHPQLELALRLIRNGVPAGPVLPVDESMSAPHTAHREMVTGLDRYRGVGTPIKMSRTPGGTRRPPPKFGEERSRQHFTEQIQPCTTPD